MMPPNTTLTSRTASRGALSLRELCLRHLVSPALIMSGLMTAANTSRGRCDEGYLIPSANTCNFPSCFQLLLSSFLIAGADAAQRRFDVPYHRDKARSNIVASSDLP